MIDRCETKHIGGEVAETKDEIVEVFDGYGGPSMPNTSRVRCRICKRVQPLHCQDIPHALGCPHYDLKKDNLP